jgi:hypothetical protein
MICYKAKKNAKNAKDKDKFVVAMQSGAYSSNVYKWIINSRTTNHVNFHRAAFDTYKVISPHTVRLDDRVANAMQMRFIVFKIEKIGKINKICITNVL